MREWIGTGTLAGYKVAVMGGRKVARFNGRLVAAADCPPAVRRQLAGTPAKSTKAPPKKAPPKKAAPKKAPTTKAPAGKLLPRASRAATLWVWYSPARRPTTKSAGGLRFLGGWADAESIAAAVAAGRAKAADRRLGPGVIYAVNASGQVARTTSIGG